MKSFILFSLIFLTHGGGTDSRGGHYDRINGGYHFHHGNPPHSHFDGCPYLDNDDNFWWMLLTYIGILFSVGFLLVLWRNLHNYYLNRKFKKDRLKEKKLKRKEREDEYLYLKKKQYNLNNIYIPNQLTEDEAEKFKNLQSEFEQAPINSQKKKWYEIFYSLLNFIEDLPNLYFIRNENIRFLLKVVFFPIYWFTILLIFSLLIFLILSIPFLISLI